MAAPGMPTLQTAVILLFKASPPVVLFPDSPERLYEELKIMIKTANASMPKLIEKDSHGPIKKLAFLDTELAGVSLQVGMMPPMPQ